MEFYFYLSYYWNWVMAQFSGYPLVIKITLLLVGLLLLLYVVFFGRFLFTHRSIGRFEKLQARQKNMLEEPLLQILFSDHHYEESQLKEDFKEGLILVDTKLKKRAFTHYILDLLEREQNRKRRVNLSNYITVLDTFGIIDFWNQKMSARKTKTRQEALRVLDDLNIGLSGAAIQQSVYHKDKGLRRTARAALMKYDLNDPYRFLEEGFDVGFNGMDEVRLHYFFSQLHQKNALPPLIRWVHSDNESYRAFLIREIGFFGQKESCPSLLELYGTEKSARVKREIVRALAKMEYQKAKPVFMDSFAYAEKSVQRSIIEAMPHFKSSRSLDFLSSLYPITYESDSKIKLAYAMGQFGTRGKARLKEVVSDRTPFDHMLYAQVEYQLN